MRWGCAGAGSRRLPQKLPGRGRAGPGGGGPGSVLGRDRELQDEKAKGQTGKPGALPIAALAPRLSSPAVGRGAARSPRAGAGLHRDFVGYMIFSRPIPLACSYFLTSSWTFKIREKKKKGRNFSPLSTPT